MDEQDLDRLIRRRDRIAIDLQVMEMADGYRHMVSTRRYQKYLALKIRCEQVLNEFKRRKQTP